MRQKEVHHMRKHVRTFFTLFALVCALSTMIPLAARAASLSDTASQSPASQEPHVLLQQQVTDSAASQAATHNVTYHGGPVMAGTTHVYAIFWEPGHHVAANYNALIERYFKDIGSSPLYRIARQYKDSHGRFPSGAVLSGVNVDLHPYPRSPLLDSDIQSEVRSVQRAKGWKSSMSTIFFVFTGRGENLCLNSSHISCARCIKGTPQSCAKTSFCAYHGFLGRDTIYAAMPYAASFRCNPGSSPNHNDADQTINVTSHEQMEAASDPLLNAWFDRSGNEIGDKCKWTFGPLNAQGADVVWNKHPYIVQREWSNARHACRLTP